jgi:outer membrane protein assembly factor BamB
LSNRLAQATSIAQPHAIDAAELQNPVWPKFRGPNQDGSHRGFVIDPDWKSYPPKEIWRIKVGPAWSSFIAAGKYLFTQEQRGEQEVVVAYDRENGSEVWSYSVQSRFFESLGGLGPRATPTLDQSSIYALGAEGWLVKLDATDGNQLWKVDLKTEAQRELPPMWGFSSSPLVSNGLIIVHAGGEGEFGVLAFRAEDGTLAWKTAAGPMSYGSVQEVTLLGRRLLAMLTEKGAHFWEPTTGESVVDYEWPHAGYRALQPRIIDEDKLLIATGVGTGSRLVKFSEQDGKLVSADLWTATDLKPDFNDLLIHEGSIYGFDNRIFCCLDLSTGKKHWKGGRYEKGQALLLADSDLIIVISETGELVLLRTNPDKLEELAKLPALTGKTWNHPIVIDDRLYLRNASEAVCYQLPVKK